MTARLVAPVPALHVDMFRVLAGLLVLAYFLRHIAEIGLYHGADSLVPHAASRAAFPFTWQPLFPAIASTSWITAVYVLSCALAVAIVLGVRPRTCALVLYGIVVATYRHDFLVMFVDDVIVHLVLFWLVLLPVGSTLRAPDLVRAPKAAIARWRRATVRGTSVRLFLGNLALLYFVAGTSKWTSPLWRSGDALYAVAKLPMSFVADVITPSWAPALRVLNAATMVVEPLLGVAIFFSSRPRVRAALVASMVAFHLGIVATVDVPFANLGCLLAIPLLFRSTRSIAKTSSIRDRAVDTTPRLRGREHVGALVLALLVGAMGCALFTPPWRAPDPDGRGKPTTLRGGTAESGGLVQTAFFGVLWCGGLAQQYRLLDWIDDRNFSVTLRFRVTGSAERTIPADRVLPRDMRSSLLLSYLGGVTWMPVPPEHLAEVRAAIAERVTARACSVLDVDGTIALEADYERTDPSARAPAPRTTLVLARGRCEKPGRVSALFP